MKKRRRSDDLADELGLPSEEEVSAAAAYYRRTGAMPVNTIGPPVDRPIIPSRRPERIGDFALTADSGAAAAPAAARGEEDPQAATIRKEFVATLNRKLKGL